MHSLYNLFFASRAINECHGKPPWDLTNMGGEKGGRGCMCVCGGLMAGKHWAKTWLRSEGCCTVQISWLLENFVMLSHGSKSQWPSAVPLPHAQPPSPWRPRPLETNTSWTSPPQNGVCGMNISEIIWRATKSHQNIAYVRAEPASLFPCACVCVPTPFAGVCVCACVRVCGFMWAGEGVSQLPSWE